MARALFATTLLGVALVLAPTATAGTEANPEIVDHAGNVVYSEYYTGSQDHEYLDLLGMWWAYDAATDRLDFHLKGVDFEAFSGSTAPDLKAQCWLNMNLLVMDGSESIHFRWSQYTYGGEFFSDVNLSRMPQPAIPLQHEFTRGFSAPGYMTWSVSRELLLLYGETLSSPQASCIEEYFPAGVDPSQTVAGTVKIFGSSPIANRNPTIRGEVTLNLTDLAPQGVEFEGAGKARALKAGRAAGGDESTPTIGTVLLLAILSLVAFGRRRS